MVIKHIIVTICCIISAVGALAKTSSSPDGYSVGTINGNATVNAMGAACYDFTFNVPNSGVMTPQIGIAYNSQNGRYGIAGYGFDVTGISAITSGGKDLFHDGELAGAHYDAYSSLYLDGKRLVLKSGSLADGTAVYDVEGSPHTTITASGIFDTSYDVVTDTTWVPQTYPGQTDNYTLQTTRFAQIGTAFTVHAPDGSTYEYGTTDDSKLFWGGKKYDDSQLQALCAAWYLTKASDKYGNTIEYTYSKDSVNHRIYPVSIKYGVTYNAQGVKLRDANCTIAFSYDNLVTTYPSYYVGGYKITTTKKLKEVYCKEGNQLYRKYTFAYSTNLDNITTPFTRLTSVTESNGSGESLAPITFEWNEIPAANTSRNDIFVYMDTGGNLNGLYQTLDKKRFFSFDINNDGLTDLVRIDEKIASEGTGLGKISINLANRDSNGNVSFNSSFGFRYPSSGSHLSGFSYNALWHPADLNGDGTNEILNYLYYENEGNAFVEYRILKYNTNSFYEEGHNNLTLSTKSFPLTATLDWDGDGKDEVLLLESSSTNNNYRLHFIDHQSGSNQYSHSYSTLNISSTPKKLFVGDFDNDGLQDLMVVHDNGYKIFSNTDGGGNIQNSDFRAETGTNVKNANQIEQGDFNGDGLIDFILFTNNNNTDKYQIAYNLGNGHFSTSTAIAVSTTLSKVDNKPTFKKAVVYDIDGDGKSDVVTIQYGNSSQNGKVTTIKRFLSNGTGLQSSDVCNYYGTRSSFLDDGFIFLSDFDGDGIAELTNYGTRLDENNNTDYDNCIHIYKNTSLSSPGFGKLASVTDGFGISSSFSYDVITKPDIYEKGTGAYPVNSYTLPVSVVRNKNISVGNTTVSHEAFTYKDLKVHLQGKGMLGFSEVTKTDSILDTTVRTKVVNWNNTFWIPSKNKTWVTQGGTTATTETTNSITAFDNGKNYFSYVSACVETDFDGNTTTTTSLYDTAKGVPLTECVANSNDMYKKTEYGDYVLKSGVWLPLIITATQKHEDDDDNFIHASQYTYDNLGNVTKLVEGAGNEKELTTSFTYDRYGNILTKNGLKAGNSITEHYDYDVNGRYVTEAYQVPDFGTKIYRYGNFGIVTEECDSISADHVLVTRYEYDGWGRRIKTINPDSTYIEYDIAWNSGGGYMTTETPNYAPSVTTVYDALGRKVSESTKGRKGVDIISSIVYNSRGQVSSVSKTEGNLTIGTSYSYDNLGRKTREDSTTGASVTYSYGNRTITTSNGITTVTNTYDAWGNVVETDDSLSTVSYTYSSNGSPVSVTAKGNNESDGHTVYMEYDEWARKTSLTDPDAGTMSYTYTDDGTVLSQTDSRNIRANYWYDSLGRPSRMIRSGHRTVYRYNSDGYGKNLLASISNVGDSLRYEYDRYRRIKKEYRKFKSKRYEKLYEYNALGNLSKVTYPGGLEVTYSYDASGFLDSVYANDSLIYRLDSYDGLNEAITGVGGIKMKNKYDTYGFLTVKGISKPDNSNLMNVGLAYNRQTGNVTSRNVSRLRLVDIDEPIDRPIIPGLHSTDSEDRTDATGGPSSFFGGYNETYGYDTTDRLISVTEGNRLTMTMEYDDCGNITYKTGVGEYTYDDTYKPHAVVEVENRDGSAGSTNAFAAYHPNGKLERLAMDSLELVNTYCVNDEKWQSQLLRNDSIIRTVFYFDDFEEITENDSTYSQYFLENNVIVIKRNGSFEYYQGFTDHLGNILNVYDSNGHVVFEARYDAWGKQTIVKNDIGLRYGYTGHEMLPEFGLVDMKGRVYDPVLGRFLSPDNYVQEPTNSQSFNRYSYCVNNPLKYTDPSGEIWNLIFGGLIGGVINWATHGCKFNWDGLKYFGVGAAAGAIGAGIAGGINVAFANGNFLAGALGTAKGVASTGFISGAVSGACSGFSGGFITGAGNAWIEGSNFLNGLKSGFTDGAIGALSGGLGGGIYGGLDAISKNTNFWTGNAKFDLSGAFSCVDCNLKDFSIGEETIAGKYVGDFEGVNVFETKKFGSIKTPKTDGMYHYRAATIPERGIIAGEGVFSSGKEIGKAMMQHEFGHILQYRQIGSYAYWHIVAPESFANAIISPSSHDMFWTETWANYLSKGYFQKAWIGGQGYPTSNISSFNMWRIKNAQLLGLMHRGRI